MTNVTTQGLTCKSCGLESQILDEVCFYDINRFPYTDPLELERNAQNPDALAHTLCSECAEKFNFKNN